MKDVALVIDMISDWDYEGADEVSRLAQPAIEAINRVRATDGLKTVFANDLQRGFHGSRESAFALAMGGRRPDLVAPLEPLPGEDFIHKGQHSAFYGTPLAHLLDIGDTERIFLTGQVTEQCVLYTALDAHVRGYEVAVVTDAVLSQQPDLGEAALMMIEQNMGGVMLKSGDVASTVSPDR